jgi:hexokinase
VDLIHGGVLFQGNLPSALAEPYKFETQFMSRIERDHSQDLGDTKAILEDLFGVSMTTLGDRRVVKRVCELVGIRAARLSAAAVAGVVIKMNKLNGYGRLFCHFYNDRICFDLHQCAES